MCEGFDYDYDNDDDDDDDDYALSCVEGVVYWE